MTTTYTISNNDDIFSHLLTNLFSETPVKTTKTDPYLLKNIDVEQSKFKLVAYNADKVTPDNIHSLGIMRSLLFTNDNRLVCFSPPKTMKSDDFKEKYPDAKQVYTEDCVEGTMINMFWDEQSGKWEFMTRKNVGATNSYYIYSKSSKQSSFRSMFLESLEQASVKLDNFDKAYSYSFVMQHPSNRIVVHTEYPVLYLVEAYKITSDVGIDNPLSTNYEITVLDKTQISSLIQGNIRVPKRYPFSDYNQHETQISPENNKSWDLNMVKKGFVVRDLKTNVRTKFITENYKMVQELKTNIPDMRFLYLKLRKGNTLSKYLQYFPEHNGIFLHYFHLLSDYTHCLYSLYKECYISKVKPLKEYTNNYRTHMYTIHGIYLNTCKPQNRKITLQEVVKYVNNLDVPLLFDTLFKVM